MPVFEIKNKETGRRFQVRAPANFEIGSPASSTAYSIDRRYRGRAVDGDLETGEGGSTFVTLTADDDFTEIVTDDGVAISAE